MYSGPLSIEATHVSEGKSLGERYTVALLDPSEASVDATAFCFSNSVVSALSGPTSLITAVKVGGIIPVRYINSWHCVVLYISLAPLAAFFTVLVGGGGWMFSFTTTKKELQGGAWVCTVRNHG